MKQRLAAVLRRFVAAVAAVFRKSLKYLLRRSCGGGAAVSPIPPIALAGALGRFLGLLTLADTTWLECLKG